MATEPIDDRRRAVAMIQAHGDAIRAQIHRLRWRYVAWVVLGCAGTVTSHIWVIVTLGVVSVALWISWYFPLLRVEREGAATWQRVRTLLHPRAN